MKLLTFVLVFASLTALAQEKPIIRIGAIIPLSGDMALHGIEVRRGLEMGLADSSPDNLHYKYELVFEDNALDAVKSVSAAQKLLSSSKVDAVVTLWPPTALVVLPLTEKAGVLHYTISWDPNIARKNRYVLSHQAMVDDIARATLRLLKKDGYSKIAFLHMEESGFNVGAEFIRSLAQEEEVSILADESFQPSETDFRSLLDRVERKSPSAYVLWTVMPSMDILIKQLRERAAHAKIEGYLDYASDLSRLEGANYVSEMYASDEFIALYRSQFGTEPLSKGANAFDIMKLLLEAFEHFPDSKPTAGDLKGYLTTVKKRAGAVGNFSIGADGNSSYPPVIRQIEGGKRVFRGFAR